MAMQPRIRKELNKARELLRFMLRGETCFFCHGQLIEPEKIIRDGDGTAEPLALAVTIHHKNGNHEDDSPGNGRLAHQSCHKAFHARIHPRRGGKFVKRGHVVDVRNGRRAAA